MNQDYIVFDNVKKSYDGKQFVVKNFNMRVAKGEFVTMLGPSGSGKTTCLMMLAGFEDITDGEIYINQQPLRHVAPYKRNIGMVFQNYALFPHMTVAQNLAYPLKFRKYDKQQRAKQVAKYLALVELSDFANRYPAQLSGGQRQRIALARAMIYEPELILMDEPLGALDKNLREQMQYEIKRLHGLLGFTVIYVTHDQTEALTMSDRVAVFNHGEVQQIAPSDVLYTEPANKFVAEFISENNYLYGHITSLQDKIAQVHLECATESDEEFKAISIDEHAQEERVYLSIRPEKIMLNPEPDICDNLLTGTVCDIIYVGDHSRVYVTILHNQAEFIVKHSHNAVMRSFAVGDAVTIGWLCKDWRVLKAED